MKLCLVTAALVAMASTTPAVAARAGLRRRELVGDVDAAFEEDVLSPVSHHQYMIFTMIGWWISVRSWIDTYLFIYLFIGVSKIRNDPHDASRFIHFFLLFSNIFNSFSRLP